MIMATATVGHVRQAVAKHIGRKVEIRSNLGRHKYDVTKGTIKETYPGIFLVQLDGTEEGGRTVSYSYADVIARDVQLTLCYTRRKKSISVEKRWRTASESPGDGFFIA